jgi:hypothetical protein
MLHLDGDKARAALGEDTDFYMDERPIPYAVDWQVMEVDFQDAYGAGEKLYPDISENVGKLFLSERAYATFKDLLAGLGEFLPVRYADQKGYVFNCLKTVSAVGELSVHDPLNDRFRRYLIIVQMVWFCLSRILISTDTFAVRCFVR